MYQSTDILDQHQTHLRLVREELDAITAKIADLTAQRAAFMTAMLAELTAHGIEAHVVPTKDVPKVGRQVGAGLTLIESWISDNTGAVRHGKALTTFDQIGRRAGWSMMRLRSRGENRFGLYHIRRSLTVVIADVDHLLIVKAPGSDDEEASRRRSIAQLRSLARKDGLSIRVRDLEVSVLDPTGTVIHVGDVPAAYGFLLGVQL